MKTNRFQLAPRHKAAILAGALIVGFLFCEIAARVYVKLTSRTLANTGAVLPDGSDFAMYDIVMRSDNPKLIYELRPNRQGMFRGAPYQSNSLGLHGPETAVEKPPNTFRIATLGDSTMFGWGVLYNEAYPFVLERALNSVGDSVHYEVLNFAVPGYNTAIETESFIARASNFDPDLVIIQFDINDITLPSFIGRQDSLRNLRKSYFLSLLRARLIQRRALGDVARMAAPRLQEPPMREAQTKTGIVRFHENRFEETPKEYRYMVGWDGVRRALDRLWANSDQPVVHLSNPYPLENQEVIDVSGGDVVARHIREAIEENPAMGKRLFYLDISRAGQDLAEEIGVNLYTDLVKDYPKDLHPAAERHILIAREVYLGLARCHVLPPDSKHYQESEKVARALREAAREMWNQRMKDPDTSESSLQAAETKAR